MDEYENIAKPDPISVANMVNTAVNLAMVADYHLSHGRPADAAEMRSAAGRAFAEADATVQGIGAAGRRWALEMALAFSVLAADPNEPTPSADPNMN